jgi:hypothetical protein
MHNRDRTTNRVWGLLGSLLLGGCPIGCDSVANETGESGGDSIGDTTTGDGDGDGDPGPPEAPVFELSLSQVKQFDFDWTPVVGAQYYRLLESADTGEPFVQVGGDVMGSSTR